MQVETWRRLLLLHTWCGVLAAWALFIVFFAGALTTFAAEIRTWTQPSERRAPHWTTANVERAVQSIVTAHPQAAAEIVVELDAARPVISWTGASGELVERTLDGDTSASRDEQRSAADDLIYRLHYTLGLPETLGMYLVGVICIVYGIALVCGTLLYARNILPNSLHGASVGI